MAFRRVRRWLVTLAAVVLGTLLSVYAYHRTTTAGPCTLRLQQDDTIVWALGDAELGGNSVLSVEARDARLAYVYVADNGACSMLLGGVFLYAVELGTGRVAWKRKL